MISVNIVIIICISRTLGVPPKNLLISEDVRPKTWTGRGSTEG